MAPGTLVFTRALWGCGARLSLWFKLNLGESSRIYVSRLNQVYVNFAGFMAPSTSTHGVYTRFKAVYVRSLI